MENCRHGMPVGKTCHLCPPTEQVSEPKQQNPSASFAGYVGEELNMVEGLIGTSYPVKITIGKHEHFMTKTEGLRLLEELEAILNVLGE